MISESLIQKRFIGWDLIDISSQKSSLIDKYMEIHFSGEDFIGFIYSVSRDPHTRLTTSNLIKNLYLVGSLKDRIIYEMGELRNQNLVFDSNRTGSLEEMLFIIKTAYDRTYNKVYSNNKSLRLLYFYDNSFNNIADISEQYYIPYSERRSECLCTAQHLFHHGCMCLCSKEISFNSFSILNQVFK